MIAADIPALKWVLNNAALYCDPYQTSSFADTLEQLLYSKDAQSLQASLKEQALKRADYFSAAKIKLAWEELLFAS